VKHQQVHSCGCEDLLGEVEWFLMLEAKAQDFIVGKIDRAVLVDIQFIPPPTLSLFEV
jgi:hypothetical protein